MVPRGRRPRDHRTLDAAFQQEASHLWHDKEQPGFDFLPRAVECTKSDLGLRFYLVLAALGEEGLARYVERRYRLAARVYDQWRGCDGIEMPVAPEANIFCFRVPGSDARQLELRNRILWRQAISTSPRPSSRTGATCGWCS